MSWMQAVGQVSMALACRKRAAREPCAPADQLPLYRICAVVRVLQVLKRRFPGTLLVPDVCSLEKLPPVGGFVLFGLQSPDRIAPLCSCCYQCWFSWSFMS